MAEQNRKFAVVAKTGRLCFSKRGVQLPTGVATAANPLAPGWFSFGYLNAGSLNLLFPDNNSEENFWQDNDPYEIQSSSNPELDFEGNQFDKDNLSIFFNTVVNSDGSFIPKMDEAAEGQAYLEIVHGSRKIAILAPLAKIKRNGGINLTSTGKSALPMKLIMERVPEYGNEPFKWFDPTLPTLGGSDNINEDLEASVVSIVTALSTGELAKPYTIQDVVPFTVASPGNTTSVFVANDYSIRVTVTNNTSGANVYETIQAPQD